MESKYDPSDYIDEYNIPMRHHTSLMDAIRAKDDTSIILLIRSEKYSLNKVLLKVLEIGDEHTLGLLMYEFSDILDVDTITNYVLRTDNLISFLNLTQLVGLRPIDKFEDACRYGASTIVRHILKSSTFIHESDGYIKDAYRFLYAAIVNSHLNIISLLVDNLSFNLDDLKQTFVDACSRSNQKLGVVSYLYILFKQFLSTSDLNRCLFAASASGSVECLNFLINLQFDGADYDTSLDLAVRSHQHDKVGSIISLASIDGIKTALQSSRIVSPEMTFLMMQLIKMVYEDQPSKSEGIEKLLIEEII